MAEVLSDLQDDWVMLAPTYRKGGPRPLVSISLAGANARRASAFLVFRRGAMEWVSRHKRVNVFVGGDSLDQLRIARDPQGAFPVRVYDGYARVALGHVNVWPNEIRESEACEVNLSEAEVIIVKLPADYGRPRAGALAPSVDSKRPRGRRSVLSSIIKRTTETWVATPETDSSKGGEYRP